MEATMTRIERTPERWISVTFTGDEDFPPRPWDAEYAAGPPYPDYWEGCPACKGDGCGYCDGIGRLHPVPADWVQDELDDHRNEADLLNRTLQDPDLAHRSRRASEWLVATGQVAQEIMYRWHLEDTRGEGDVAGNAADRAPGGGDTPNSVGDRPPRGIQVRTIWGSGCKFKIEGLTR